MRFTAIRYAAFLIGVLTFAGASADQELENLPIGASFDSLLSDEGQSGGTWYIDLGPEGFPNGLGEPILADEGQGAGPREGGWGAREFVVVVGDPIVRLADDWVPVEKFGFISGVSLGGDEN